MIAKTNSTTAPTIDVVSAPEASVVVTEAPTATAPASKLAAGLDVASNVVTSVLDALEKLRAETRRVATAGIAYSETVGQKASAGSKRLVERFDAASGSALVVARQKALDAIASARTRAAGTTASA